jgi:hypothetical protein
VTRWVTHTHVGMGMCMRVNPYPPVYMGDLIGLFFCRGYGYGVVIPGGYLPIAILSAFRDQGVPGLTSEMSPRAPTQMGRREAEREGGKKGSRRRAWERWKSRGLRVRPAPRSGALAVGGYKRPRGRGSERPHASACPVLFPARSTPCKRALVLPFIGVRRGSRCTMGGVAECYVSSGGELAP